MTSAGSASCRDTGRCHAQLAGSLGYGVMRGEWLVEDSDVEACAKHF